MSESPAAKVVASVMLKRNSMPTLESFGDLVEHEHGSQKIKFKSTAHDGWLDVQGFDKFVRMHVDIDDEVVQFTTEAVHAVELLLQNGVDFQSEDHGEESHHADIRRFMHSTCLPSPCQTQFVETGVKEAKNVSTADRSEQH